MTGDTDTMDLIGGFEQYDPLTEVLEAGRDLQIVVLDLLARGLQQDSSHSEYVSLILSALQIIRAPNLNVEPLKATLSRLAGNDPNVDHLTARLIDATETAGHAQT